MAAYDTTVRDAIDPPQWSRSSTGWFRYQPGSWTYFPRATRSTLTVVVALCVVFLASSFYRLNNTDLWGHLSFGRWISEQRVLPTAEPFATAAQAEDFTNVAWLAQVWGYRVHQLAGLEGLALMHVVLLAYCFGVSMLAIHRRGASLPWAVAGGLIGYVLALPIVGTIRPQLAGGVGMSFVLLALARLETRRHPLFWLPPVFALWANLHGSFAVGLAVISIWCTGVTWEGFHGAGDNAISGAEADRHASPARWWLVLLLCVLASCLNPLGPKLLLAVASFGGKAPLAQISEWQPLVLSSLSGVLFFSSLLVTAVLIRTTPRRIRPHEVLVLVALALLTLLAMRMLLWWSLVWPWVVAPHAMAAWQLHAKQHGDQKARQSGEATTMRTLLAMAFVFMTLLVSPPSHGLISGRHRGEGAITSRATPLYVADEIQRRGLTGPLFAPMDWADYLIWHSAEQVQPLVYSHVHLVRPDVWQDYIRLAGGGSQWLRIVERHHLKYLVLSQERNGQLWRTVRNHPRTRLLYQDQQSALLEILPKRPRTPS